MEQNEFGTVTLYLDSDETIECQILCILDVNKQQYIALLPPDEEGGEESPVYIYRYVENEDGDPGLESIEDDEEYDAVCEALDLDALGLDSLE